MALTRESTPQTRPQLDYVFTIELDLDHQKSRTRGERTPSGLRYGYISVDGGRVYGPRLSGRVLPGGGDGPTIGMDDYPAFDARYILELDDGTLVRFENRGMREPTPSGAPALDGSEIYFRTVPTMRVPPGPHEWLGRSIFIGAGRHTPTGNRIDYFLVSEAGKA